MKVAETVASLSKKQAENIWAIVEEALEELDLAYWTQVKTTQNYNDSRKLVSEIRLLEEVKDKLRAKLDPDYMINA